MAGLSAPRYPRRAVVVGLLVVVVLFTADASGLVVVANRRRGVPSGPPAGAPAPRPLPASPTTTTSTPPAAGQSVVTGTVSTLSAAGATGPSLTTPLLITIPVRGQGSAYIYHATIGGQPGQTIYWYGGQPLSIEGAGGALIPGRVNVTVDGSGSTWYLDGAERRWVDTSYRIYTPVAVGASGLGTAEPSADFDAGPDTVMVTSGGATLHRPPAPLHLIGPGAVQARGRFSVRSRAGTRDATTLDLAPGGDYVMDLTPTAGGITIAATLQGRVSTG